MRTPMALRPLGRLFMAFILVAALCLPTGALPVPAKAYANEASRAAHEPIASFLKTHAQEDSRPITEGEANPLPSLLAGTSNDLVETGASALVKYTLVDANAIWDGFSLDDAFERGEDALVDYVLAQQVCNVPIYKTTESSDSYVCLASAQPLCGGDVIVEALFAHADDAARIVEDARFDHDTGIAYLPKSVVDAEGQLQIQLVVAHDPADGLTRGHIDVRVNNHSRATATFSEGTVATPLVDTQVSIPLVQTEDAGSICADDLAVRVNGTPTPLSGSNYSYDASSGVLSIAGSPLSIASVDVTIEDGAGKAWAASGDGKGVSGGWQSIPNVELTNFDANAHHAGDRWDYTGQTNYTRIDEQGDLNAAEHRAATWITHYGYRIKAVGSREDDEFYDTIKDGSTLDDVDAALYSGYAFGKDGERDVSTGWKYMSFCTSLPVNGWKGNAGATVPAWAYSIGEQLCNNNRSQYWNSETNAFIYPLVTLLCCHASAPFRGAVTTGDVVAGNNYNDDTPIRMRLMAVAKDYIVIGLVTPGYKGSTGGSSLGGGKYQAGAGMYKVKIAPKGRIEVQKGSANTAITKGNACYSLQGAEFEIADASGKRIETISTNAQGYARSSELLCGTYTVRETKAPKGYALNAKAFTVEVAANATTRVLGKAGVVTDEPLGNPIDLLVGKTDPQTGSNPQGAGRLAGARFTVRYYDGYYDQGNLPSTAVRSWTFETDAKGEIHFADTYLKAGDALYRNARKQPIIPLGTIAIQETRAPTGYTLDDGTGSKAPVHIVRITADGARGLATEVESYKPYEQPDSVQRGDFRLVKRIASEAGIDELGAGIQFQIINENDNPVAMPGQDGKVAKKSETVCTIAVDENGLASTRNASANGWSTPAGWSGALAYGTYRIHEVVPDSVKEAFSQAHAGATITTVPDWRIAISGNGQYDAPAIVTDGTPQSPLKIVKVDSESGKPIPLPCSFQIYDQNDQLVTYEAHYPEHAVMDTWTTNEAGEATLPMMLHDGAYTLREVEAPEGYALAGEPIPFSVSNESRSWDNPLVVTVENAPAKGEIHLTKSDDETGTGVAGARYEVYATADVATPDGTIHATEGDVVAELTCDDEGSASACDLYLGTYAYREVEAPEGYALDEEAHPVELAYEGQAAAIVSAHAATSDGPTTLRIAKTCSETGRALEGARFRVERQNGTAWETETNAEGIACIEHLEHGHYRVAEVAAPPGWEISEEAARGTSFTVDEHGLIHLGETDAGTGEATLHVENEPSPPEAPMPNAPAQASRASPSTSDDAYAALNAITACATLTLLIALAAAGIVKRRQRKEEPHVERTLHEH